MKGEPTAQEQEKLERDWEEAVGRRFRVPGSHAVARVVLEQVADEYFAITGAFEYDDLEHERTIMVDATRLHERRTDLTSVPRALTWFVGKYGRHTPAALLHDSLLYEAERAAVESGMSPLRGYEDADETFLVALHSLQVPPLRRITMWAAVAFGTRLRSGGWARMAMLAWLVTFVAGTGVLVASVASGNVWTALSAGLAPLVGAALWGRQYHAGVVASYAAPFVAVPTIAGFVTFLLYRVTEAAILQLPGVRDRYEGTPYTGF